MKLFNINGINGFQVITLIFLVCYLFGILNIYFSDKNNYCAMTYMFEYPQFVRIDLDENRVFPQYGLYAYSEGRFTERARKMWFDGIPVLFLPGNSGSHMQTRSLASVALRKALSSKYEYHFDYFTISYNEELSGLYGGVLQSQTEFAAAAVSKILSLYKSNGFTKSVPTSIILIGHSMGGLIAKRLMAHPSTINTTNVAITLATPLESPVINVDPEINKYYTAIDLEWLINVESYKMVEEKKFLISIGSGPRDVLVPSGLTSSRNSHTTALATAIPGVWASPDHVSMVWCKQLVMVINRFLFDIIDRHTTQITENRDKIAASAKQYFEANRSMTLNPEITRPKVIMQADSFWYEDNRRVYQITRPEIERTTHLMIRLISYPQNRFLAVEAVNVNDKDWIFGCNAKNVHNTHRYCKEATSLTEMSRWTGGATKFGKRKFATVHLHSLMEAKPEWTHVVVKVSPTKKPIVLNVDVNDHASREINVGLPSDISLGSRIAVEESEPNSIYYELVLSDLNFVHQAYLLYVEPTSSCQATEYHVTAELHVPWAKNHESLHYFTNSKNTPMKLRVFKNNPNATTDNPMTENVRVTLLLDPKCQFKITVSNSWYHRLAQLARNYTPVLLPYVVAILLLAARSNLLSLKERGYCISIHSALMSEGIQPYYVLILARFIGPMVMCVPILRILFKIVNWNNLEILYFSRSLLVLPTYMVALGLLNVVAAAVLFALLFSSQLAHRLLFRVIWRGGSGISEKMADGLQKIPMIMTTAVICLVPLSCGAASLAVGAAFYAFLISKMLEEYLEDYVYLLMSKAARKISRMFKAKDTEATTTTGPAPKDTPEDDKDNKDKSDEASTNDNDKVNELNATKDMDAKELKELQRIEDLNRIHFHIMLFFMWMSVTILNIPVLLTWARNFKYGTVFTPDTSYYTGFMMSACSAIIWQMDTPKKFLLHYETLGNVIYFVAIIVLAVGPFSLAVVNYAVTYMFAIITIHQWCGIEDPTQVIFEEDLESITGIATNDDNAARQMDLETDIKNDETKSNPDTETKNENVDDAKAKENVTDDTDEKAKDNVTDEKAKENVTDEKAKENVTDEKAKENVAKENPNENVADEKPNENDEIANEHDVPNDNNISNMFKNLREKLSFNNNLEQ